MGLVREARHVRLDGEEYGVQGGVDQADVGRTREEVVAGSDPPDLHVEVAVEEGLLEKHRIEPGAVALEVLRHREEVADVRGEVGAGGPVTRDVKRETGEAGEPPQVEIDVEEHLARIGLATPLPSEHIGLQIGRVAEARRDTPSDEGVTEPEPLLHELSV